jgi:nitrogen regulatory protein P-II 1
MRKIEAVIQPYKLDKVREELSKAWVQGLTISDVQGFGRQKGHAEMYRGVEYAVEFLPKVKLEVVVPDGLVPKVVDMIRLTAYSGRIGDGKIFVLPVDEAMRIRTRETGEEAL